MSKKTATKSDSLLLSVSSVETFLSCKAKWYYRYVEHLPSPSTYHTTAGSFIHKILEIFLRRYAKSKNLRDAGNVAFYLAKKDPELAPSLTDEIIREGKDWLKFIVKKYEGSPELIPNPLKIEAPFTFKVNDTLSIRGFIDRIDTIDENTLKIVDYKTSSNPNYLTPFQLTTYSIAVAKKYPGKTIHAAYELIRHEFASKEFSITKQDQDKVIETFVKASEDIRHLKSTSPDKSWEPTVSNLCAYCPFRVRCELDREKSSWSV